MKEQANEAAVRPGLIVAISLVGHNPGMPGEDDAPYSSQKTEESTGQSPDRDGVENLPPEQPDVYPLERDTPDVDEVEENKPTEQPEIDSIEAPVPDIDEIEPDTDREIDTDYIDDDEDMNEEQDNIDRDPTIQPGTDPMKEDNSQII
ncbi:hypothetical protein SAMN05660841_00116 [Sphingobacterium nematocida]|uniref:Uncharacterized protein n=1 Tax=Sphingobacterium nematocida TaxID=1513896 RepID=A0A1T5ASB9_9SPHI|nr:hypothetical protein [Sphingobacterium nematocida]SKB37727.1 hypothetical protein SAMN05660841_00116 [Sphingobacterium nematocida]